MSARLAERATIAKRGIDLGEYKNFRINQWRLMLVIFSLLLGRLWQQAPGLAGTCDPVSF
jgi:hypothetical protein